METETIENEESEIYSYQTYNIFAYIIGLIIFPLLGLIMGIVGVKQRKKHAWSIIVVSIIGIPYFLYLLVKSKA